MTTPLDPIIADRATAGGLISLLKLARWCLAFPDLHAGRAWTPDALPKVLAMIRGLIWDAIDSGSNVYADQCHADAIADELGLTGIEQRLNVIEHQRRSRRSDDEIVALVDQQLIDAIQRLQSLHAPTIPFTHRSTSCH
jgi:hypothetical protein